MSRVHVRRRYISDNVRQGSGIEVFLEAVEKVPIEIREGREADNPTPAPDAHSEQSGDADAEQAYRKAA